MNNRHEFYFSNPISLQHDVVNLWYFKHWLYDQTEFTIWNIKGFCKRLVSSFGICCFKDFDRFYNFRMIIFFMIFFLTKNAYALDLLNC